MSTKTKVLLVGPICNQSGYSEHARTILDALLDNQDNIDLYVQNTQWAASTYDTKYFDKYKPILKKTEALFLSKQDAKGNVHLNGFFDASFQVKPPNEFEKISDNDIGVTAALETTKAPVQWIPKCNMMNHIFVVSNHAKKNLENTKDANGNKISTPITVIPFGYNSKIEKEDVYDKVPITTSFNFLSVLQMAPRKNFENMLKWFIEEFENDSDVGLVVKTQLMNNSTMDFHNIKTRLRVLADSISKNRKCKIYLLHGNFSEEQMVGLYDDNVIDCYLSLTHGEGFGIPIFNAACNGIPIIATNWSGHLDFLRAPSKNRAGNTKLKSHFLKVDYDIMPVQDKHLMPNLITKECEWAYPKEKSFRKNLRFIRKNKDQFAPDAESLKEYLRNKFSSENIHNKYKEEISKNLPEKSKLQDEVEKMFSQLSV